MKQTLKSLKDTQEIAVKILQEALLKKDRPIVFALKGELGAGKTTFTKILAKELGIEGVVTSPTFLLMKVYEAVDSKDVKRLVHIDAYRIKETEELISLGFEDILRDKNNLIIIEWPEKLEEHLPQNTLYIEFKIIKEEERKIYVT